MGGYATGRFLEMVGRQPIVLGADKLLEEEPCAAGKGAELLLLVGLEGGDLGTG